MNEYTFDVQKTKDEVVAWIRDFFEKNGPGCNAVVGISGGKDSLYNTPAFSRIFS